MPPARRELLVLGTVGLTAAVAGALFGPLALQSQSGAAELLSASFPDITGKLRKVNDFARKTLVANFWATWCEPCREEVPLLIAINGKFASAGGIVLGIGIDDREKLARFAGNYGINYPVLVAGADAMDLMHRLGNRARALPFTVVLDRNGSIAHRRLGALQKGELDVILARIMH